MKKTAGFALNALLVVTCILTCINIGRNWLSKPAASRAAIGQPSAGTKLDVPEIDWARFPATLVLVVSPTCHFCDESVPLYRKLVPAAALGGVGLVVISPGPEETTHQWLSKSGLAIAEVRQLGPKLRGTFSLFPTVALVDGRGVVEQSWTGSTASDHEKEIVSAISRARKSASGT